MQKGVYLYKHPDSFLENVYKIGKSIDVIKRLRGISTTYFNKIQGAYYINTKYNILSSDQFCYFF